MDVYDLNNSHYDQKDKRISSPTRILSSPSEVCSSVSTDLDKQYHVDKQSVAMKLKSKWSRLDDIKLFEAVETHGKKWELIKKLFPQREINEIQSRYQVKLDKKFKFSNFTKEEDRQLMELHNLYGNKWNKITKHILNRSANTIKSRIKAITKINKKEISSNKLEISPIIKPKELNEKDFILQQFFNISKVDADFNQDPIDDIFSLHQSNEVNYYDKVIDDAYKKLLELKSIGIDKDEIEKIKSEIDNGKEVETDVISKLDTLLGIIRSLKEKINNF